MPLDALTPYVHVGDLQRSIEFYGRLGLEVRNEHREEGRLVWAFLTNSDSAPNEARARLMLALADEPVVASAQAVLFYCWTADVRALHAALTAGGLEVSPITHPFYMPAGELSVHDPDGYLVVVGQLGEPVSGGA